MTEHRPTSILFGDRVKAIWIFIFVALFVRLATLGVSPLYDLTEGRYAEIGREMAATGDWITPRLGPDKPFFSKPPLHYWMTAFQFRVLGVNEFAARLPGFLSALVTLGLTWLLASRLYGRKVAAWASLVLVTSAVFFFSSAWVMTDMTLCACVTGVMVALILALHEERARESRLFGYAFFAFLGLGMLAKGPVAVALCTLAVLFWLAVTRRVQLLKKLPWGGGLLLAALICVPWYVLAEVKNPGFLRYFIVNEHILRYLKHDFGEQYGSTGHTFFRGMIWAMLFAGLLPWSPLLLVAMWRAMRRRFWRRLPRHDTPALLIGWALAPLALFTPARSVMITYILPAIPACAILAGQLLGSYDSSVQLTSLLSRLRPAALLRWLAAPVFVGLAGAFGAIIYLVHVYRLPVGDTLLGLGMVGAFIVLLTLRPLRLNRLRYILCIAAIIPSFAIYASVVIDDEVGRVKSTRDVAEIIHGDATLAGRSVVFFKEAPYSAEFYLGGRVSSLNKDRAAMRNAIVAGDILVIAQRDLKKLSDADRSRLERIVPCAPYAIVIPKAAQLAKAGEKSPM